MRYLSQLHLGWIAAVMLLAGCQEYQVHQPENTLRLHLAEIQNDSQASQVVVPLTRKLRQRFASSSNVVLVNQGNADGSIKITLSSLEKSA